MRLLLDTHTLLWWFTNDNRLSRTAHEAISDMEMQIYVSAASAWEIATKQRIGKLDSVPEATARFPELVAADGFLHLPISYLHGLRAGNYRVSHRDPFDRMLAAQCELECMTLVTKDPAFALFGVETLW